MISQEEVKVLDANARTHGVPEKVLMENAGKSVAEAMDKEFDLKGKTVLVICGSGNNGGDGFVAARYLKKMCKVKIFIVKEPKTELAKTNLRKVKSLLVSRYRKVEKLRPLARKSDIIVDALLGVGIKGELRSPYRKIVNMINKSKCKVVSVDIPTGFGTRKVVDPNITITFHDKKEGMTKRNCGKIIVSDIGIPPLAEEMTGPGEPLLIPRVAPDAHKGERGKLLVVGGGPYYGAPALAALAAQGCGVDLVYLMVPENIVDRVCSHSLNFIVQSLEGDHIREEHVTTISRMFKKCDAMVLGPGMGMKSDEAVLKLIGACPLKMVVDADALKALDGHEKELKGKDLVLTPHSGEFRHLTSERPRADIMDRCQQAKYWSRVYHSVFLLKGDVDVITDGLRVKRNETGNEAMSTGGTGDVLSGIVGALLAKGMSTFDAARVGSYINGKVGDASRKKLGHSMSATDMIETIPDVMKRLVPWWMM